MDCLIERVVINNVASKKYKNESLDFINTLRFYCIMEMFKQSINYVPIRCKDICLMKKPEKIHKTNLFNSMLYSLEKLQRKSIYINFFKDFFKFTSDIETIQRNELMRLQRVERDKIYKFRASYIRKSLKTSLYRGFGPQIWPRHCWLPPSSQPVKFDYIGIPPIKSCLKITNTNIDTDTDTYINMTFSKQVIVTNNIQVISDSDDEEFDVFATSHVSRNRSIHTNNRTDKNIEWQTICYYSSVKHMVMMHFRDKYGCDATDPDGWVGASETWDMVGLDNIFCEIKYDYQKLHDQEELERKKLEYYHNSQIKQLIFSNLDNLIGYGY